jgi:hypothetical protein
MAAREAFDRLVAALEGVRPGGELRSDLAAVDRSIAPIARHAGRGAVIVVFSDFIDLPDGALERFAALASRDRIVIAVRVLDPVEAKFPFEGPLLLRSSEGLLRVETDALAARAGYLDALERIASQWRDRLVSRGGRFLDRTTSDDPVETVRSILNAAEGRAI